MGRVTRRVFLSAAAPLLAAQRPARKGSKIRPEKVEIADPLTGRPLFRLTDPAILHHLPHYHHHFIARNKLLPSGGFRAFRNAPDLPPQPARWEYAAAHGRPRRSLLLSGHGRPSQEPFLSAAGQSQAGSSAGRKRENSLPISHRLAAHRTSFRERRRQIRRPR